MDEEKQPNILKDEVRAAVKQLKKKGKVTGSDSIPIETQTQSLRGIRRIDLPCTL